jgi:hypothetical protein
MKVAQFNLRALFVLLLVVGMALGWWVNRDTKPVALKFDDFAAKLKRNEGFDVDKHIPAKIRKLNGQRVRIKGYIHPSVFTQHGIRRFVLQSADEQMRATFGPSPPLDSIILVEMAKDHAISFHTRPIAIEGELNLDPQWERPADQWRGRSPIVVYRLRHAVIATKAGTR